MSMFKGLIKCGVCKKNYRKKMERKRIAYCCSGYMNHGREYCTYRPVFEDDLIMIISKHFAVQGKSIRGDVRDYIKQIEVSLSGLLIQYVDGSRSIIDNSDNYGVKVKF